MNYWQIKVSIKDWAKDGNEFQTLHENMIYPQKIQDKSNEPRDNINDIVFVHNTRKGTSKEFPDGLYFICQIVTKIQDNSDKKFINLKVIKNLKDEPIDLEKYGFEKLKAYINKQGANGRIYAFKEEDRGGELYNLIMADSLPDIRLAEELSDEEVSSLEEGAKKTITVNKYERNSEARNDCIKEHGCICSVCGFDFEKVYGDIGKSFIHVHHIKPLHTIGENYEVNPITDLRPVCPNCHAMLHKRRDIPYSIQELQEIFTKNG